MFNKTVDSVVKSLTNMITDLDSLVDKHWGDYVNHLNLSVTAEEQATRARNIKTKLQALLA